ncbi:MAG TPA: lipoprotein LpqH [Actinophytocola sp.]|nr:lipoprotein LpqH [Actinophytocola sp.]
MSVSVGAALLLVVSGCSDDKSTESAGQPPGSTGKPAATTIDLTLNGEPVDLTGAASKCYDYEGHLMVEAHNAADPDASHFLIDYYQDKVALSIGVRGGQPNLFEYEQGKSGQAAKVTRDGDSVSATGTIGVALDDSTRPQPFTITARCAMFFNTPPDSSKVDSSDLPSIPPTCPPGEAVCLPGSK